MMRLFLGAAFALALSGASSATRDLPEPDSQTCDLMSAAEASKLLVGPAARQDADGPSGALYCAWSIDNGATLETVLSITLLDGTALGGLDAAGYFSAARTAEPLAQQVSGIGQAALASRETDGAARLLVLNGNWIALVRGSRLKPETVAAAAQLISARLGTVQHPLSHPPTPPACRLLSPAEAAPALGHMPYVVIEETPEAQGVCTWSAGGTASLSLVIRDSAGLGGQGPEQYVREAGRNAAVSQSTANVDVGEDAFLTPSDPRGGYFLLMFVQNDKVAVMSGLGIERKAAVEAARLAAARL